MDKKLKLIDKYILSQVAAATFVCILLFVVVWIAPETLLKVIKRMLSGDYTLIMGVKVLAYEVPKILNKALPVGLLLGTLFTFDKLSKDSEITVMRAFGLSFNRIILSVVVLSLFVTGLCFIVFDKLIPFSVNRLNIIKGENPSSHFVYTFKKEDGSPEKILIVSAFDNKKINKVVVLNFTNDKYNDANIMSNIMIAENAAYQNGTWILPEFRKYVLGQEGVFEYIKDEKNAVIAEGSKGSDVYKLMTYSVKRERELNNNQLLSYVKLLKKEHLMDEYNFMLNKYLQRYLHSFICVLFAVLGCILGFSNPREQRLIGFTIAIALVFAYYITLPFFDLLAEKRLLSPYLTASIAPIAITALIFIMKKIKDI